MESIAYLKKAGIFQGGHQILSSVNLSISRAEFVYLIGRTGRGKSSLLKTLWGELPLLEGEGKVDGFDLHAIKHQDIPFLRRKLGIIFQDFQLFKEWTVDANLEFVLEATGWKNAEKRQKRMQEVLNVVRLLDKSGMKAYQLSGGEQQRLVIARAILNNPALILADEPTGNLDPKTSDEILRLLRDLAVRFNTAILMATHDFRILSKFPGRVYECKEKTIKEL